MPRPPRRCSAAATRCSCATPVELGSIRLVERRVLLAAGVALLIALLLGYGGARMFARRIRRLERAADRIASGRFDEPVVDTRRRRARRARRGVRADARPPRASRRRAPGVRRQRLARAAHAALLARPGSSSCSTTRSSTSRRGASSSASMREQVDRLTKLASDLLDLSRLDAGPADRRRASRSTSARWRPTWSRSSGRWRLRAATARPGSLRRRRSSPRPTSCGCSSSAGSWSRTRSCTRRRERRSRCGLSTRDRHAVLEVEDAGGGIRERAAGRSCSSGSSASTARAPRAAASGWRSQSSWPS